MSQRPVKLYSFAICVLVIVMSVPADIRVQSHKSIGEQLVYSMNYLGLPAATATFSTAEGMAFDSIPAWCFSIRVKTNHVFSQLFHIDNHYETLVYSSNFLPIRVKKEIDQRNVKYQRILAFDQQNGSITMNGDTTWHTRAPIYDLLALLFYFRMVEFDHEDTLWFNLDCEMVEWLIWAVVQGHNELKTPIGKFFATEWILQMQRVENRRRLWKTDLLTNQTGHENAIIKIWIGEDERRLPLKIQYRRKNKVIDLSIKKLNPLMTVK